MNRSATKMKLLATIGLSFGVVGTAYAATCLAQIPDGAERIKKVGELIESEEIRLVRIEDGQQSHTEVQIEDLILADFEKADWEKFDKDITWEKDMDV